MKFTRFTLLFTVCALLLTACADNAVQTDVSDAFTTEAPTTVTQTENFITDAVTEDVSADTSAQDTFLQFDSDQFKQMIYEVYSRPLPAGSTELSNINDLAFMCTASAIRGNVGPIGIVRAKFTADGNTEDVYIITLGGTEFKDGQATDVKTDILVGLGKSNDYLDAIINTINSQIPENSKLFITGISLGGMVAQQVISDPDICKNYEIVNTVCIGSPLIINENSKLREGKVIRIEDYCDFVPKLSIYTLNLTVMGKYSHEKITEKSEYTQPLYAHAFSYVDSAVWQKYDVAGTENGDSTLRFDADNITYYDAPIQ